MQVRRYPWMGLSVLALWLAACAGGSGSSGFDAISEDAAITQALRTQQCVQHGALEICPTDEGLGSPTPTPAAQPTPTAVGSQPPPTPSPRLPHLPRVDTGLSEVSCAPVSGGSDCSFMVPFAPQGFPPSAVFRVAVRRPGPGGPWSIVAPPTSTGTDAAPSFDTTLSVSVPTDAPSAGIAVQVAILVFVEHAAPAPGTVKELGDSGADFAFVTQLTLDATAIR